MNYKTPGVYVEEISKFPPSVAQVETAIPAFIGYTERTSFNGEDLLTKPVKIRSLADYDAIFGGAYKELFEVTVSGNEITMPPAPPAFTYKMYFSLKWYYDNGGGPCYIISVGSYATGATVSAPATIADNGDLNDGLEALEKEDEPTIILFPDAVSIADGDKFYNLYKKALQQCALLQDRVTICEVHQGNKDFTQVGQNVIDGDGTISPGFRNGIGNNNLKYGAVYYPWVETLYSFEYDPANFAVKGMSVANMMLKHDIPPEGNAALEGQSLFHVDTNLYNKVLKELSKHKMVLPPGPAIAGIYATVDRDRGVWKAPANVSLSFARQPVVFIDDSIQEDLNVHTTGKSVNAIRAKTGKGIMVWGARTLAGNDNEWRYISVRRFYNMVEESVKKASEQFVFENNDANTWAKVRSMIRNYLTTLWRQGAFFGATPDQAFYIMIGMGETMTALDILEGKMIVEIGMAVVRPAEFIILRFAHKMQLS
jgi:uncharacterized protein